MPTATPTNQPPTPSPTPGGPTPTPTNTPPPPATCPPAPSGDAYEDRFMEMWCDLHDPANGYFSPQGVPYHSVETMIIEAPDYGHETTSEAYSYWLWLEAMYGAYTGDWSYLDSAWTNMEAYIIPTQADQPTNSFYNPNSPAGYAAEWPLPNNYPSPLNTSIPVGQDPIGAELSSTYGTSNIYGMHWLLDVDNIYGYGRRGDGTSAPSYINTFQRGEQESVWEAVPHPSWENFAWGGPNGFLDLFIQDGNYAQQWRYTNAPDADARVVQALYWAKQAADAQGGSATVDALVDKASRMGDYLRYSLFDKYFKTIPCLSANCAGATGRGSAHYYSAGKRVHTGVEHAAARTMAFEIMDRMWTQHRDTMGVSAPESRGDYVRLDDPVYVPPGWTGVMGHGDPVNNTSTFLSIRSFYLTDPMYAGVRAALNAGEDPTFNYHRFWAQTEVALANAELDRLFP